jgi:hypothetical protein
MFYGLDTHATAANGTRVAHLRDTALTEAHPEIDDAPLTEHVAAALQRQERVESATWYLVDHVAIDAALRQAERFASTQRKLQALFSQPGMEIQPGESAEKVFERPVKAQGTRRPDVHGLKARYHQRRARQDSV